MYSEKIEYFLNQSYGSCWLKKNNIAEVVANSLSFNHEINYKMICWCIMPNPVHVVFEILNENELEKVLHSWKSYTANEINKILNRTGKFWYREYYDHLVRDNEDLIRVVKYTLENPSKAGLDNWKWVWLLDDFKESLSL